MDDNRNILSFVYSHMRIYTYNIFNIFLYNNNYLVIQYTCNAAVKSY